MNAWQRIRRRHLTNRTGTGASGQRAFFGVSTVLASIAAVAISITGAGALFGLSKYNEYARGVVPPQQLLEQLPRGGARIYDRNGPEGGVVLYEFLDELGGLRRPVPLAEISRWMIEATIATEDQSFYENNGLNTRGITRAIVENLTPFSGEMFEGSGGSSITQQLAKTVYIPLQERYERSIPRKIKETVIALELTDRYSKDQILEWYLNSISYGSVYVGIEAAAEGYFGKDAKGLTLAEASLLAGIPQSPAAYEPIANPERAKRRQAQVLDLMVRHNAITQAQADEARETVIKFHSSRFRIIAPHFVLGPVASEIAQRFGERALYEAGLEITTTLDANLQKIGEETVEKWVAEHEKTVNGNNGALIAMDPKTGEVLTYVGSRDYFRENILGRNNNITALNSPGSSLKPFTYITAFQQGWSPDTTILDTPTKVLDPATGKDFSPTNPGDGALHGVVTVAQALGNSFNIPAFKTAASIGYANVLTNFKRFGITQLGDASQYGPSLTLGGVDTRLDDVTYAYSSLATGGVLRGQQPITPHSTGERTVDPVILKKVVDAQGKTVYEFKQPVERRVMAATYAYMATEILSNPQNTCITFGCGYLELPDKRPSARKTGTSEPFENQTGVSGDTWTFGFTPDLVVGVWNGNSDNSPMRNIYSTTIAWPIWRDFMTAALKRLEIPSKPFARPPQGLEQRDLCWPSGRFATNLCPADRIYKGTVASESIPNPNDKEKFARLQDTWWQRVVLDTRTGYLATPETPATFVRTQVRLVLPQTETEWTGFSAWAADAGIASLITLTAEASAAASAALAVTSPTYNQRLTGIIPITGRAATLDFERVTVEWGTGLNPVNFLPIFTAATPITGGAITTWDTRMLPDGDYVLRIRLNDKKLGELRYTVPVFLANTNSGGTARQATAVITSPATGSNISGTAPITGTAFTTGTLLDYVLELGEGASPTRWTQLRRSTATVVNSRLGEIEVAGLGLRAGVYTLRLIVRDTSGVSATTTSIIAVQTR